MEGLVKLRCTYAGCLKEAEYYPSFSVSAIGHPKAPRANFSIPENLVCSEHRLPDVLEHVALEESKRAIESNMVKAGYVAPDWKSLSGEYLPVSSLPKDINHETTMRVSLRKDGEMPEVSSKVSYPKAEQQPQGHIFGVAPKEDTAKGRIDQIRDFFSSRKEMSSLLQNLEDWIELKPVLQKNDLSRVHRLIEAIPNKKIFFVPRSGLNMDQSMSLAMSAMEGLKLAQIFVVKHDWAAVLLKPIVEAAEGKSLEVVLPYPNCVFEFMICGRCVILWATQTEGLELACTPFVEIGDCWYSGAPKDVEPGTLFHYAYQQLVASCIGMEADVAVQHSKTPEAALNRKREKKGKPLLKSYHVVDLKNRVNTERKPTQEDGPTRNSPRLHFRRGHWRHFHKINHPPIRIKWQLVGNPDLGFISKEYSL